MKKSLIFLAVPLFLFVMMLGFASAASVNATSVPGTVVMSQTSGSFTFKIVSDSNQTVNINIPSINSPSGSGVISFSYPSKINVTNVSSETVTVKYNTTDPSYFDLLTDYPANITLSGAFTSKTYSVNMQYNNFCDSVSNQGNLEVDQPDFSIVSGYGNSDTWYLMDNISASVDIYNNGAYDLRNVKVEWALYTSEGNKIDSGTLSTFSLNSGDDKTVDINFKLDKNFNRIDNAGGNVYLYVKATGTLRDTSTSHALNGEDSCAFYTPSSQYVETGDDFVISAGISLNGNLVASDGTLPGAVNCGSTVNLAGTAYNIGSSDQSSGGYIIAYNSELGINQKIELGSLNGFSSQDFSSTFQIPQNADEKIYQLQLMSYDNNNNIYENSNNDQAIKYVYFNVSGNCAITPPTVTAQISSGEAKEGKQVTIHVYLRNEDTKTETFLLSAQGYNSWGNLVNITPQTFTLGSGYSKDVYLTFNINSNNAAGTQQFDFIATSNGQVAIDKPVVIQIAQGSALENIFNGANWELIGIVALNVILLILIIVVAAKVLKRR